MRSDKFGAISDEEVVSLQRARFFCCSLEKEDPSRLSPKRPLVLRFLAFRATKLISTRPWPGRASRLLPTPTRPLEKHCNTVPCGRTLLALPDSTHCSQAKLRAYDSRSSPETPRNVRSAYGPTIAVLRDSAAELDPAITPQGRMRGQLLNRKPGPALLTPGLLKKQVGAISAPSRI